MVFDCTDVIVLIIHRELSLSEPSGEVKRMLLLTIVVKIAVIDIEILAYFSLPAYIRVYQTPARSRESELY